jgi:hypothetical protein
MWGRAQGAAAEMKTTPELQDDDSRRGTVLKLALKTMVAIFNKKCSRLWLLHIQ